MSPNDTRAARADKAPTRTAFEPADGGGDPFSGNSVRVSVNREINVGQLGAELSQRTKVEVQVALRTEDPSHLASENRPATLYVSPGNISERVIRDVVAAHTPTWEAGPQASGAPATTTTINPALLPDEVQETVQRLERGETLKGAEISDLLRSILGIPSK